MKLIGRSAAVDNPECGDWETARFTNQLVVEMDCFYDVGDLSRRKKEEIMLIGENGEGKENEEEEKSTGRFTRRNAKNRSPYVAMREIFNSPDPSIEF